MKIRNLVSNNGNKVANQFEVDGDNGERYFQSYDSVIVMIKGGKTTLDERTWDYSRTTARYRNQFLGETTKETQAKIDSGEYVLGHLN